MNGIAQITGSAGLGVWLLSLCMFSASIVGQNGFLFCGQGLLHCVDISPLLHSPVDEHLHGFYFWALTQTSCRSSCVDLRSRSPWGYVTLQLTSWETAGLLFRCCYIISHSLSKPPALEENVRVGKVQ